MHADNEAHLSKEQIYRRDKQMKKTIAGMALALALMLALLPTALASNWSGDPTQMDEDPYDILMDDDAPPDIYEEFTHSPKTGDTSSILMLSGMSGAALSAIGVVLKKRAAR